MEYEPTNVDDMAWPVSDQATPPDWHYIPSQTIILEVSLGPDASHWLSKSTGDRLFFVCPLLGIARAGDLSM